jgi:4-amino-4-deoxy-L-arabinose transferase-like glycosyltransferase
VHSVLDSYKKIPSYSVEFFGVKDFIILIISIFVAGIHFISAILCIFYLFNNLIASYLLGCSVIRFSASDKKNVLNA